jgi:hypothetical protein
MARLLTPSEQLTIEAVHGSSIQQILDSSIPIELKNYTMVFINGQMITDYEITVRMSDSVLLAVVPQGGGGKNILGAVLTIAVMVAAVVLAAPTGGASLWLAGATGMSATTAGLIIGAGVSMVGMMMVNALVAPPSINTGDLGSYGGQTESPTYSISGQSNQARKYAAVSRVYGTHKVFPSLAANPLISNLGSESRITALYDFGLGDLNVVDIKIGDADFHSYNPEWQWHKDLLPQTKFMSRRVGYDQFAYTLKQNQPVVIKTKPNTIAVEVDISFPKGMARYNTPDGNPAALSSDFTFYYRAEQPGNGGWVRLLPSNIVGANAYTPSIPEYGVAIQPDHVRITATTSKPFVAVLSFTTPAPGTYEVKVEKVGIDHGSNAYVNDSNLTLIKSYQDGKIVNLLNPHTILEMRLLATDKVSGVVQNLSGIATSVLRYTTDSGATFATKPTNNPAWIAIDILSGTGNPKPLSDSMIDWASWQRLADFCDRKGFTANFVVDYSTTVQELLNSVLSGCRSSLMITNSGKYGCLIDEEKTIPRQMITPSNSWGFSGTRTFVEPPHAFRVGFINPALNWQRDERLCYADGYNENNATKFETLDTFGCTSSDEAWRYGRYMMAQGIHRSETFTVTMDVEHLVAERGSLVHVANDVVQIGGMPCRVVSVNGNNVTVNTSLSVAPSGYSVRLSDGSTRTGRVTTSISDSEFTLDDITGIDYGDLMVLGIMDRVVQPYIIQSITPGSDLTAELTLVKYVPEVYTADTGAIPPWNPGFGDDLINQSDLKVIDLRIKQNIIHVDRMPFNEITLDWGIDGFNYEKSDIYYSINGGKQILLGSANLLTHQMMIDLINQKEFIGVPLEFEVVPVSRSGVHGVSAKISITPEKDSVPPEIITGFAVNIQDMQCQIYWDIPRDRDVDYYEIRYSPHIVGASWNVSQRITVVPHDIYKVSCSSRTGTYFIQATDTSGNRSKVAQQRTTIETLPHINQVDIIDDSTKGWSGTLSGMVKNSAGNIESGGDFGYVNDTGYYNFADMVKLDDIFEVRVANKTTSYGRHRDDIVAMWHPVSSAFSLVRATPQMWNATTQIRTSDGATVMADWLPMEMAKPLEMSTNEWTGWRNFTVTDVTARQIQFRIKAESYDPNVKVIILDGEVEIDANDWVWKSPDTQIPSGGKQILYDPPFMYRPVVAITIDGTSTAIKYEQTNSNRHGFNLRLLDDAGNPVAGQVDIAALGQGKQRLKSI